MHPSRLLESLGGGPVPAGAVPKELRGFTDPPSLVVAPAPAETTRSACRGRFGPFTRIDCQIFVILMVTVDEAEALPELYVVVSVAVNDVPSNAEKLVDCEHPCEPTARSSPPEQGDGSHCTKGCKDLEPKHRKRRSWALRQPSEPKDDHQRQLSRHEQLPDMGCCALVGFLRRAEHRDIRTHCAERDKGQDDRKPSIDIFEWGCGWKLVHRLCLGRVTMLLYASECNAGRFVQ